MRAMVTKAVLAIACVGLAATSASAATISIQATGYTSGNFLGYFGLGVGGAGDAPFVGLGHGTYQLGTCGVVMLHTECVVAGSFVEVAGSVNPGLTGTFVYRMVYPGTGANPIVAGERTGTPDLNDLQLGAGFGGFFDLTLSTGMTAI